ncbi:MAG: hypothetical protein JWP40_1053 [Blastococcus sp.]|jgi:hypothetical protein|nr:hypothetical protein [Blastococcus sp.]
MNATISKLRDKMNEHDAQGMAGLFAPDYRSEQPSHPHREFGGRAQVAVNWGTMFRDVPDLTAEVVSSTTIGSTAWTEWIWRGHHTDGSPFEMRGVTIMGLTADGLIAEARLYMETVEQDGVAIENAVQGLARPST